MKDLIDELPGINLPVSEVTKRLQEMWQGEGGGSPHSAFRASQMNVVLHFGWEVTAAEALERFESLIHFAQRYPSRIIVLCPSREVVSDGSMRAKLFSQCYIGESHREMCCCEALILGYQPENCGHLGNQVSVWLESDLPTYHWFNRVPAERISQYMDTLLVGVRRSIYDSSVDPDGAAIEGLSWPDRARVVDLAKARLLPVRQAIGQYLSGFAIEDLCRELESVTVHTCGNRNGEGNRLMEWLKDCFGECGKCEDCSALRAAYALKSCPEADCALTLELRYRDGRRFYWKKLDDGKTARLESTLGRVEEKLTVHVKTLAPEQEIAEALFF